MNTVKSLHKLNNNIALWTNNQRRKEGMFILNAVTYYRKYAYINEQETTGNYSYGWLHPDMK